MKWPWSRPEIRESSYTEQVLSSLMTAATGSSSDGRGLAVVEIAARLYGSALASATVAPSEIELAAITPILLDSVGRNISRHGESLYVIDVRDGRLILTPCSQWNVLGDPDPASWKYCCTLSGPSSTRTVKLDAASVVHIRYSPSASRPWSGRSPLSLAFETAQASGLMEGTLQSELAMTVQQMLSPKRNPNDFGNDLSPESLDKIVTAVAQSVNRTTFALPVDAAVQRLGPSPSPVLPELREGLERSILAAYGLSPLLVAENPTGTGLAATFRQFLHVTIKPIAAIVCQELQAKLHPDCELTFGELRSGDIQAASRSYASLVKAGLTPKSAASIVGFDIDDIDVVKQVPAVL